MIGWGVTDLDEPKRLHKGMCIHVKKVSCFFSKIDITKAFDLVSWPFLLEVLQHMGFSSRWQECISSLMSTLSMKILLNGRPCRRIHQARGLRQGDPLSPMLFVLVMDVTPQKPPYLRCHHRRHGLERPTIIFGSISP